MQNNESSDWSTFSRGLPRRLTILDSNHTENTSVAQPDTIDLTNSQVNAPDSIDLSIESVIRQDTNVSDSSSEASDPDYSHSPNPTRRRQLAMKRTGGSAYYNRSSTGRGSNSVLETRREIQREMQSINRKKKEIIRQLCPPFYDSPWNVDFKKIEADALNLFPKKWKQLMEPLQHMVSAHECGICVQRFLRVEDARAHYHSKRHIQYHLEKIESESVHNNYLPAIWRQKLQQEPNQILSDIEGPDLYW